MNEQIKDITLAQSLSLINSYDFDLGGSNAEELLEYWLDLYHASWIRLATIEALYLGRYKVISVEQILNVWLRLGTPNTHFGYEFERLICRKLPKHLNKVVDEPIETTQTVKIKPDWSDYQVNKPVVKLESAKSPEKSLEPNICHQKATLTPAKAEENLDKECKNHKIPLISALRLNYQADWSELTEGNKIIRQFIPLPDVSSFFDKLKTFGEERLEGQ